MNESTTSQPPKPFKYKAFISYKHSPKSRQHAVSLETALKRYAKPTLAWPVKIFRDEKHMKPDINLPKLIRDGLDNSEYLIFLAEKDAAQSQWCAEELEYWCGHLHRTEQLIVVLIDDEIAQHGTSGVHWEATTALPVLLKKYISAIPLYMDFRWAKTPAEQSLDHADYKKQINGLVARFRNVAPEDLNDEEIRVFRRNIRLRNWAIGLLASFLLIAAVALVFAFRARNEALTARNEALAATKTAQTRLRDALQEQLNRQKLLLSDSRRKLKVFQDADEALPIRAEAQRADSLNRLVVSIQASIDSLSNSLSN